MLVQCTVGGGTCGIARYHSRSYDGALPGSKAQDWRNPTFCVSTLLIMKQVGQHSCKYMPVDLGMCFEPTCVFP